MQMAAAKESDVDDVIAAVGLKKVPAKKFTGAWRSASGLQGLSDHARGDGLLGTSLGDAALPSVVPLSSML